VDREKILSFGAATFEAGVAPEMQNYLHPVERRILLKEAVLGAFEKERAPEM